MTPYLKRHKETNPGSVRWSVRNTRHVASPVCGDYLDLKATGVTSLAIITKQESKGKTEKQIQSPNLMLPLAVKKFYAEKKIRLNDINDVSNATLLCQQWFNKNQARSRWMQGVFVCSRNRASLMTTKACYQMENSTPLGHQSDATSPIANSCFFLHCRSAQLYRKERALCCVPVYGKARRSRKGKGQARCWVCEGGTARRPYVKAQR